MRRRNVDIRATEEIDVKLGISKTRFVMTPTKGTEGSAGLDFYVPNNWPITTVHPGDGILIPSGIKMSIPRGYVLIEFNKSGMSAYHKMLVGANVIDSDYQGEIHLSLINVGHNDVVIKPRQKIVQFLLLVAPILDIEVIAEMDLYPDKTGRGEGGFGSTDK